MSYAPIRSEPSPAITEIGQSTSVSRSNRSRNARLGKRNGHSPRLSRSNDYPIIAHSHLCWDWVWQRPQQFLSRLSRSHRVLFVETVAPDPELAVATARFRTAEGFPNLTVLRLQFPCWRWEDSSYVDAERRRLVLEFLSGPGAGQFDDPVQWFYDPMSVTAFAGHMDEQLTVYDCMDELANFRFAPPEIRERERELIGRADVVFTGGRKLFESKRRFHSNCHFFGCGVDLDHFGKARSAETPVAEALASAPKPVLGYFGVIDERLDYELIDCLAEANPKWAVAMVGPVLKVDQSVLPRRENILWLGKQEYEDLPRFCKGFDVCLMPFALNEATEYINPTKTLEYMATGRAIVSTAVADVVSNFGDVVRIAKTPGEFIEHCHAALKAEDRAAIEAGVKLAGDHTWESIVIQLENHVRKALRKKQVAVRA